MKRKTLGAIRFLRAFVAKPIFSATQHVTKRSNPYSLVFNNISHLPKVEV